MVVNLCRATMVACVAALLAAGGGAARDHAFTPPALQGLPQFVISGHGWGHGIGMSQYGAQGYAQNGWTYDQILAHYYTGTQLGTTTVKTVRVLLANTPSVTVSSAGAWTVKDGTGTITAIQPGAVTLNPQLSLTLPGAAAPQTFTPPLTFNATAAYPLYFKKPYRGTFTVTTDGTKLTLVNTVPLESYLYGVVPSEMPSSWLDEALKAQAVAARSYAVATRKTTGAFDVYADTRSQVYGGMLAESAAATAAVDETTGQVVMYQGAVATTYFSSTSGGRTASIEDVWNTVPVPYLVSVDDPYDSISPYHDWGPLSFTAAKVKTALKVPGRVLDLQTTLNASGRVAGVIAVGDQGEVSLTGAQVQSALGLRSTWFDVGVLALDPLPKTTTPYGTSLVLTGIARNLGDVQLESRVPGETTWTPVGPVTPGPDGSVSIPITADAPVEYHFTTGGVASAVSTLLVAPTVKISVPKARTLVRGRVDPLLPGAALQVQQQGPDGKWTTLARSTVGQDGRYEVPVAFTAGTYRVRVAPGHHWAVALVKFVLQ
ncbi:MAG: SpoIID/LytB domain-containing protein [Gaiellaceae bacterium]